MHCAILYSVTSIPQGTALGRVNGLSPTPSRRFRPLSIYPSLSSLPRPLLLSLSLSLSQSTSFPSFIDFFAVVDSRYYYGRARGRWLSTTRPRLTCFASFFLCARLRLRARGKEGGIAKSLSMPPPAQNVADPRARAPCQSIAPSTAVMTPFL